ncbi:MAG: glycosyltransferase family protein [Azoarcus sp.]|jgi:GT2 family glycosyltransferase|nr:glycosyltransferase family protein [Azoarcus sp.]
MKEPFFSIVVCSIDPWKFAQTRACYERLLAGYRHEILGIHDARSLAEGYGRGLTRACGNIIVFSHDDVLFLDPDFGAKIAARMADWDLLGFAGATRVTHPAWFGANWPHLRGAVCHASQLHPMELSLTVFGVDDWPVSGGIHVLDGLCMIARREVAERVGFDADTFDGWHLYDCDFSFAAHLAGFRIGVCCDIPYIHASGSVQTEENVYASRDYLKYGRRFVEKYAAYGASMPDAIKAAHANGCCVRDYGALTEMWTEAVFRRTAVVVARQAA